MANGYSALAQLINEIPDLIREMKMMELQGRLQQENREYQAAIEEYKDSKQASSNARVRYQELVDTVSNLGIDVANVPGIDSTGEALKVIEDMTVSPATDYLSRAENKDKEADYWIGEAQTLGNFINQDVRKAQSIMQGGIAAKYPGGAGFGTDIATWDLGDLGIDAYQSVYGKDLDGDGVIDPPNAAVSQFFVNNPPGLASMASVMQAQKTLEGSREAVMNQSVGEFEIRATSNYGLLQQSLVPATYDKDSFKDIDFSYTLPSGEKHAPNAMTMQQIASLSTLSSYDEFMDVLYNPSKFDEVSRNVILTELRTNPNFSLYFTNMEDNINAVNKIQGAIESEDPNAQGLDLYKERMLGINVEDLGENVEFQKQTLFEDLYNILGNVPIEKREDGSTIHDDYLKILENTLDDSTVPDQYFKYAQERMGLQKDPNALTLVPGAQSFLTPSGEGKDAQGISENARQVYDLLETFDPVYAAQGYNNEQYDALMSLNQFTRMDPSMWESEGRKPNWNLATAFGGRGIFGESDSPYYDAFYDEMDKLYGGLVSQEDPYGWDRWVYGLPTEAQIPGKMQSRYGNEIYTSAVNAANQIGEVAQLKSLTQILERGSGEAYHDLMKTINILLAGK